MKTMKLLILLAFVLGGMAATKAQEKQNDATWEETVEFLTKNMEHTIGIHRVRDLNLTTDYIIFKGDFIEDEDYYCEFISKIPVDMISKIYVKSVRNYNSVYIKTSNPNIYFIRQNCTGLTNSRKFHNYQIISFASDKIAKRTCKAFKHFVYLANEKRKESKF